MAHKRQSRCSQLMDMTALAAQNRIVKFGICDREGFVNALCSKASKQTHGQAVSSAAKDQTHYRIKQTVQRHLPGEAGT